MADVARSRRSARGLLGSWRRLNAEQRAAAIGALLLIVSTLGPFSFVEAAILLVAAAVLLLLKKRADEAAFHLPFGDGTMIAAAGFWSGFLVVVRLFDRPLGQGLLALACAAILVLAGIRERAKRPPDDLPTEPLSAHEGPAGDTAGEAITRRLAPEEALTEPLPGGGRRGRRGPRRHRPPPDRGGGSLR